MYGSRAEGAMDAWEILKARGFVQQSTDAEELAKALAAGPVTV